MTKLCPPTPAPAHLCHPAGALACLFAILLLLPFTSSGQSTGAASAVSGDTTTMVTRLPADSAGAPPKEHSVRKATVLSAVLPGAGQIYNRKIWKVPIVYGAFGGLIYLIKFNSDRFRLYENALLSRFDNDPATNDEFKDIYSEDNLRSLRDFYRRNRDLSVVGLSLVYVLNIIDAHVDAHLFSFNVDDNLSLNWSPVIHPAPYSAAAGLRLQLQF